MKKIKIKNNNDYDDLDEQFKKRDLLLNNLQISNHRSDDRNDSDSDSDNISEHNNETDDNTDDDSNDNNNNDNNDDNNDDNNNNKDKDSDEDVIKEEEGEYKDNSDDDKVDSDKVDSDKDGESDDDIDKENSEDKKAEPEYEHHSTISICSSNSKGSDGCSLECMNRYNKIYDELSDIKRMLFELKSNIITTDKQKMIEITKSQQIVMSKDKIRGYLEMCSIKGDIMLFKEYYLKCEPKPIKVISPRCLEYWANGKWNKDPNGYDIGEIISNNIKMAYFSVNSIDSIPIDDFLKCQTYIFSIKEEKYKKLLVKEITHLLSN